MKFKDGQASFWNERLHNLGVTDKNNRIDMINPENEVGSQVYRNCEIFNVKKNGDITITFTSIDRELMIYEKKGDGKMSHLNAKRVHFEQIRRANPKPGQGKYFIPTSPIPFLPPLLQKAFKNKTKIKTLFLTEGAFKAWAACLKGIYCVGLTSITHFRDKETKKLHRDIIRLITICEVENVVVLWDADCLDISQSQLFNMEDVTKRPSGFFHAVRNIRALLDEINEYRKSKSRVAETEGKEATFPQLSVHFWHVKKMLPGIDQCKGLDDLIIAAQQTNQIKELLRDMDDLNTTSRFFKKMNISNEITSMKEYFRLHDAEKFYYYHADIIQAEQFMYNGNIYEWTDADGGNLKLLAPGWTNKIIWVGDNFFKKITKPTAYDEEDEVIVLRSVETLKRETGQTKFWEYLGDKKYEAFVNKPSHYNYQQTWECKGDMFYNKYFPFKHRPKKGEFDTTLNFIKHIFGDEKILRKGVEYRMWELGLDYIQILLENPTQMLPVLILYSEENATGKSTFGNWLRYIFGSNSIKVSNKDFKSDFNEHFASKLLVVCEETLLDRRKDSESIKDMATSRHISVNSKGIQQTQMEFYAKFLFMSNNKRMIYLTKHDERYWILKVPKPTIDMPNLSDKLESEFPAFLDWIKARKIKTPNEGRMWFHSTMIKTKQFYETVHVNEPSDVRELRQAIRDYFYDFGTQQLKLPSVFINSHFLGGTKKVPWIDEIIKDYNLAERSVNEKGKRYSERGEFFYRVSEYKEGDTYEMNTKIQKWQNRGPWLFKREDYIYEEDQPGASTEQEGINPAELIQKTLDL